MPNLFFRTSIAPYRIDIYNALHTKLDCEMHFYYDFDSSQQLNEIGMREACCFTPQYIEGIKFGKGESRKLCTKVWSILRANNPKLVVVPEFQPITIQVLLYKFLFRKKFKVVSMCDDSYDMVSNDHDFSRFHKIMRKLVVPMLDDLLLVDSNVRDWYQKHYGKGIWLPIIRDEKKERPLYESALSISHEYVDKFKLVGKKVLLFVGRLVDVKNLDSLIEAVKLTKEDFTTVIVGTGEIEDKLKAQAMDCGKEIIFAGHYVDDGIRAWYNIADVFILPSKQEAYGAVTNEALIAGNYAIVSEHAGSSCLINENNGCIVKPFDIKGMANTIDKAMSRIVSSGNVTLKENRMPFLFDSIIDKVISELND